MFPRNDNAAGTWTTLWVALLSNETFYNDGNDALSNVVALDTDSYLYLN